MSTKQLITISCYTFTLSSPFASGRPLTLADRQALDRLRAENIRNNAAKRLAKRLPEGRLLTRDEEAEFQAEIAEMDSRYEFKEAPSHAPQGGIAAEALRIAQQTGRSADDEAVVEEARRRVEARQVAASELFAGTGAP